MTETELVQKALVAGWTYTPVSLCTEERGEAFDWQGPNGEAYHGYAINGQWAKGPRVPPEVRFLFDPDYAAKVTRLRQEIREWGERSRHFLGDR